EAVDWFARRPGDSAEQQRAEQRVVEGPGEVARDRNKHAARPHFVRPEQRLRLTVLVPLSDELNSARIADKLPIAFVDEVNTIEVAGDRVIAPGTEVELEGPVA